MILLNARWCELVIGKVDVKIEVDKGLESERGREKKKKRKKKKSERDWVVGHHQHCFEVT